MEIVLNIDPIVQTINFIDSVGQSRFLLKALYLIW